VCTQKRAGTMCDDPRRVLLMACGTRAIPLGMRHSRSRAPRACGMSPTPATAASAFERVGTTCTPVTTEGIPAWYMDRLEGTVGLRKGLSGLRARSMPNNAGFGIRAALKKHLRTGSAHAETRLRDLSSYPEMSLWPVPRPRGERGLARVVPRSQTQSAAPMVDSVLSASCWRNITPEPPPGSQPGLRQTTF
jgi:hypothetical protein